MKSKDRENLKNMSAEELNVRVRDLEKKLFQLKFKKVATPLENPLEIKRIRREIAVAKTFLNRGNKTVKAEAAKK